MPPPKKIDLLPVEHRSWLADEIRSRAFSGYVELTDLLNARLAEAGFDVHIGKSAVHEFGRELRDGNGGEAVNHPQHYMSHPSGVECIEVVRHMGFNLGNAIKYIWRSDLKGNAIEDLQKARFYIEDEIERRIAADVQNKKDATQGGSDATTSQS
ncbi:hypothetical protein PhaeoP75_01113 [Phaeobacter gallaeciensis]|uniref:DUF3310 domain-containing protein n=1 Tax=Phaeobacter gallaeciensis TaxID=60890 RepID=UPI000BBBA497|nr:DUF3310 domain-containing protein [Phaeobacter gallaeciensis]ATF00772.1 hypothetical protein PhaeoP75_01113 [Phaeobacter gallaeciensis]